MAGEERGVSHRATSQVPTQEQQRERMQRVREVEEAASLFGEPISLMPLSLVTVGRDLSEEEKEWEGGRDKGG